MRGKQVIFFSKRIANFIFKKRDQPAAECGGLLFYSGVWREYVK